jgi:hypothetical protein
MKRHICKIFLVAAATCATPVVLADSVIVKCIDGAGRVTLTDQQCEAGSATVRMASMPSNDGVTQVAPYPLVSHEANLPPARELQRRALPLRGAHAVAKPMEGDVATLKAARAQFLLDDTGSRQTLANLD